MNLAFITIKIPTSICLEKSALMVQSKVSRILSVSFRIICNAFVHSTSYLGRTTDNALRYGKGSLGTVHFLRGKGGLVEFFEVSLESCMTPPSN